MTDNPTWNKWRFRLPLPSIRQQFKTLQAPDFDEIAQAMAEGNNIHDFTLIADDSTLRCFVVVIDELLASATADRSRRFRVEGELFGTGIQIALDAYRAEVGMHVLVEEFVCASPLER